MKIAAKLIAASLLALTASAPAAAQDIGTVEAVTTGIAPPPLLNEDQPPLPGPGYLWTPGYWVWNNGADNYVWVAGRWSRPPRVGYLWTPAFWDWDGGYYRFHNGYWGERIGWYGGLSLGFGYTGFGYFGGGWRGNDFWYNRSVTNITNVSHITNVYNREVIVDRRSDARSFGYARHDVAHGQAFAGGAPRAFAAATPFARVQGGEVRAPVVAFSAPRAERFGEARVATPRVAAQHFSAPHYSTPHYSAPHYSAPHGGGGGHHRA